jgi:hypothetical protein
VTVHDEKFIAVEPLPDEESTLLHTCEAGHGWIEQPDGTVSPSWGYGGTHASFSDHDPKSCPEPERDEEGRYSCPGCGESFFCGHGERGVMCDPWNYKEGCVPPPPACLGPAVETKRWMKVKMLLPAQGEGKPVGAREERWTCSWVPLTPDGTPAVQLREPTLF